MTLPDDTSTGSLRENLDHEPRFLRFGTSGRRGEVIDLTQLEVYINVLAELEYLKSLPASDGGIVQGDDFFFATDLRPSSCGFVPEQRGRGEIAQAVERAIRDAGLRPVHCGKIPSPALAFHALRQGKGSIMVTGSHIPFDRNGYKTNTSKGELLKKDEAPIQGVVDKIRQRIYSQPFLDSAFDRSGLFKSGHCDLAPVTAEAATSYVRRFTDFFGPVRLEGKRIVVYQHSAVGRDLLVEILEQLGAGVVTVGRSDVFIPIDTENIDESQLLEIKSLTDGVFKEHRRIDAVVSTDGDSDRPLILGVEKSDESRLASFTLRFFGGDLVGMIVAEFLDADAVVVPISCNDAVDRGSLRAFLEPKTRIGSPHVIEGMERALRKGKRAVCGWEANGGFLTGTDIRCDGRLLTALPTRDAVLPILGVLCRATQERASLVELFGRLPGRFSRAALIRNFPRPVGAKIVERFSPPDGSIEEVVFQGGEITLLDRQRGELLTSEPLTRALISIRDDLGGFFGTAQGFSRIARINWVDGVRMIFENGDVAHVRPSGNADELRIYAVADTQDRADVIARLGVAEPDGILRRLERSSSQRP